MKTVQELIIKLNKIQKKIEFIQANCRHKDAIKIAESDTGNYDPSEDKYWNTCYCIYCEKRWTEDQ